MKYFIMVERNPNNPDFKRTRLEKLNNIESVQYDDSTYIYVNNMSFVKLDNSLKSRIIADNFIKFTIEAAKQNEILNLDFLYEMAVKRIDIEERK